MTPSVRSEMGEWRAKAVALEEELRRRRRRPKPRLVDDAALTSKASAGASQPSAKSPTIGGPRLLASEEPPQPRTSSPQLLEAPSLSEPPSAPPAPSPPPTSAASTALSHYLAQEASEEVQEEAESSPDQRSDETFTRDTTGRDTGELFVVEDQGPGEDQEETQPPSEPGSQPERATDEEESEEETLVKEPVPEEKKKEPKSKPPKKAPETKAPEPPRLKLLTAPPPVPLPGSLDFFGVSPPGRSALRQLQPSLAFGAGQRGLGSGLASQTGTLCLAGEERPVSAVVERLRSAQARFRPLDPGWVARFGPRLAAVFRGAFLRRLLKTAKVSQLWETLRETSRQAVEFASEEGQSPAEAQLAASFRHHAAVAKAQLLTIVLEASDAEKLGLIRLDRERRQRERERANLARSRARPGTATSFLQRGTGKGGGCGPPRKSLAPAPAKPKPRAPSASDASRAKARTPVSLDEMRRDKSKRITAKPWK